MIEFTQFDGGLNTRLEPHLIGMTEAVELINVDIQKGSLAPIKNVKIVNLPSGTIVGRWMYFYKDIWVHNNDPLYARSYTELGGDLYYVSGSDPLVRTSNGTTFFNAGIAKPLAGPTIGVTGSTLGVFKGNVSYVYTYYNSSTGEESQPSTISTFGPLTNQVVEISVVASLTSGVTNIKLYRITQFNTEFSLVTTLTNSSQSYVDNSLAIDGAILDSYDNGIAPFGMRNLANYNEMLFGGRGSTLHYSDIAKPYAWSEFNFIKLPADITGLAVTKLGLLVFTKYTTHIVTGTSPDTLSLMLLSKSQGCIGFNDTGVTIAYLDSYPMWLSSDGICIFNGTDIQVVTRNKLSGFTYLTIYYAAVLDNVYYLSYTKPGDSNCYLLKVDMRHGLVIHMSRVSLLIQGMHVANDILYLSYYDAISLTNFLAEWEGDSTFGPITYIGPLMPNKMGLDQIITDLRIEYTGTITLDIRLNDNTTLYTYTMTTTELRKNQELSTLGFPPIVYCKNIQFKVTGVGTVYSIHYAPFDKYSIFNTGRFYSTAEFKGSININGQPSVFDQVSTGFKSNIVNTEPTLIKLFDDFRVKYSGSITLKVTIDSSTTTHSYSSSTIVEEIIALNNASGHDIQFEVSGTGKVYDITYSTYNKYTILQSQKFYDSSLFKQSIKVNGQPMVFEILANSFKSNIVVNDPTLFKMYDTARVKYSGSITLKTYIDNVLVNTLTPNPATTIVEDVLSLNNSTGYSIQFEVSGTGKVYDISYTSFNKYDIQNSNKFFSTTLFQDSVLFNDNPIILNKVADGYESDIIPMSLTNHKMFKNVYLGYKGTMKFLMWLDDELVLDLALSSTDLTTEEFKLSTTKTRAYYLKLKVTNVGVNSKLYAVESRPLERQTNGR